jgi:TPP-dependent pyruvate/acetoin dehydrogenase alpha subunit
MSDSVPEPDGERLAWMYRQMLRIREFEERVKATFTEHPGVIRGHTHLADGAAAEVIDPRTLVPLDVATILDSV